MGRVVAAFLAGALFGGGLLIAQMTNPSKVIAFLDVFGRWDPSLALVMLAALLVTYVGYRLVLRRKAPLFESAFRLPTRTDIDGRLLGGAALFGVGWGLGGLCPGPAFAVIGLAGLNILYFMTGMVGVIILFRLRRG